MRVSAAGLRLPAADGRTADPWWLMPRWPSPVTW